MRFLCDPCGISLVLVVWFVLGVSYLITVRYVFISWFSHTVTNNMFYEPGNLWLWGVPVMYSRQELSQVGWILYYIYQTLAVLSFISHVRTVFGDPGFVTVPAPDKWDRTNGRRCDKCDHWKPPRAHHCKVCKSCIFRMDHHCPWVNNCVGFKNQKYFILFLFYTAGCCVFTGLLILYATYCLFASGFKIEDTDITATVLCIAALAASIFFLFFVVDFLTEQIDAIETNSTLVETYKKAHGQPGTFFENFNEVMGPPTVWLLPIFGAPKTCWIEPLYDDEKENKYLDDHRHMEFYTGPVDQHGLPTFNNEKGSRPSSRKGSRPNSAARTKKDP